MALITCTCIYSTLPAHVTKEWCALNTDREPDFSAFVWFWFDRARSVGICSTLMNVRYVVAWNLSSHTVTFSALNVEHNLRYVYESGMQ